MLKTGNRIFLLAFAFLLWSTFFVLDIFEVDILLPSSALTMTLHKVLTGANTFLPILYLAVRRAFPSDGAKTNWAGD